MRISIQSVFPAVLALSALAIACQAKSTAPAAPAAVSPDVWAVVDGREIRKDDVEKAYRRAVQPGQNASNEEALTAKLNLLDQMIGEEVMLAKARELKIDVPDSAVDAAFGDMKKDMPDDAFNKELSSRNLSATDMRDGLRRELTMQKVIEQEVTSKITVTDQDITDFFNANRAQFNLPEDSFHLAQIVITGVKDPQITNRTGDDATSPQAASAKAQMIMERLKSGAPFAELAMDYSEDPQSAPKGGDVGLVPMSALKQVPPALRDAVLKGEPGRVTMVPMEGGYTIVGVVAKQPAGQRDLSMPEVKGSITDTLRNRREQLLRTAYVAAARNRATVVNHLARRLADGQGTLPTLAPAAPGAK
jgi:peptidyl-prolyl cis-trans isomerase SurA